MNDCFVTKLKGVVANDALPRLGEIAIKVAAGTLKINNTLNETEIRSDKSSLSLVSGGTGASSVIVPVSQNTTTLTTVYITEACTVFIKEYYLNRITFIPTENIDMRYIGVFSVDGAYIYVDTSSVTVDLGTAPENVREVSCYLCTFNLDGDSYPKLITLRANSANDRMVINVPELAEKCPSLRSYEINTAEGNLTGTFEDFGAFKSINTVSFFNGTGTMEGFVAAQRQAYGDRPGRATGSVTMLWCRKVTFQGVADLVMGTSKTLSWTENTITFDGTTINA